MSSKKNKLVKPTVKLFKVELNGKLIAYVVEIKNTDAAESVLFIDKDEDTWFDNLEDVREYITENVGAYIEEMEPTIEMIGLRLPNGR
jgi:hypothetical protein